MKSVNLDDEIHEKLVEIADHRRKNGNLIRTNKDIIADLIMAAHIRMKREQSKQ